MLKILLPLTGLLCLGLLVACAGNASDNPSNTSTSTNPGEYDFDQASNAETLNNPNHEPEPEGALLQFSRPRPGDTLVILHTNMGDITLRFFPEEAPIAYENFVTHARNGYYDGLIFHRVINDFMIQGGCPDGTGMAGESIWGEGFGPEFSMHLRHFRGALAMAQSRLPNSIGSQFYIVHNTDYQAFAGPQIAATFEHALENQDELIDETPEGERIYIRDLLSTEMIERYRQYGGTPHLDLIFNESGHTVFGHVLSGMEIVDAIADVEVNESDRPLEDVIIERVTVTEQQ